jgi:hypothetical protein
MWGVISMFGSDKKADANAPGKPSALKQAVREARIEAAERSAVVVDLRDAELARLEILNEALDPVFEELSSDIELFDRGISRGDVPRLWVDVVAFIEMGRDKRQYRFVQDTRHGRTILAESYDVADLSKAVTNYIARRLVERERVMAGDAGGDFAHRPMQARGARRGWRTLRVFLYGAIAGVGLLFALALFATS